MSALLTRVAYPYTNHLMLFRYVYSVLSETAVDEDSHSVSAHHYVRFRRFAADMRHATVPLCRCQDVGHELYIFRKIGRFITYSIGNVYF